MDLPARYSRLSPQERRECREQYIEEQYGFCYYCGAPLHLEPPEDIRAKKITPRLYPEGFFKHPVHLHHSHVTDKTIGAVHNYCNAVLWEYEGE